MHIFAFGAQNYPPPPTPLVILHNTRLIATETTISPGAKPVMIKVRIEARMIEEELNTCVIHMLNFLSLNYNLILKDSEDFVSRFRIF